MNNQISINKTDLAVAEFLKNNNIHFSVGFVGVKHNTFNGNSMMDQWRVKIGLHGFEFFTGVGHRLSIKKDAYKLTKKQWDGVKELKDLLNKDRLDSTVIKLSNDSEYAVSPTQASVLYCLLSDADSADQNFNDWCDCYGYDSDSISHFKTYQACCDTLTKIRKIFNSKQRQELSELLQDY